MLFAIIFLWTPPHFWALAILKREDYARRGVPMLPVVASEQSTALQILAYTVILARGLARAGRDGRAGHRSTWSPRSRSAAASCSSRCGSCASTRRTAARATFLFSLLYLAALFAAMGADRIVAAAF